MRQLIIIKTSPNIIQPWVNLLGNSVWCHWRSRGTRTQSKDLYHSHGLIWCCWYWRTELLFIAAKRWGQGWVRILKSSLSFPAGRLLSEALWAMWLKEYGNFNTKNIALGVKWLHGHLWCSRRGWTHTCMYACMHTIRMEKSYFSLL